ncbi:Signal transduction histidine kinase [Arthrobacter alpinus]|uniref:histidine kinase n=1 Tax=Arthrobacter alpinus TaxID=656366 RepID=A0A1H5MZ56_9MICC|nr:histidine kinase [Arthrobacter alpinus]SEE94659.1 Signal transduction histidine kinase [Arthrobacter alpinus]
MRTFDQAGDAERTAANPADIPSVERRAAEFTARRRGILRRYFHRHPRIMDLVVVAAYLLAGSGVFLNGNFQSNLAEHVVIVLASATVLMFRRDKPLAVLVIVSVFEILNIAVVPTASNMGVSIWFALYAVAIRYRTVVSFALAVVSAIPLAFYMLFLYQYPAEFLTDNGPSAAASTVISSVVILLANIISAGIGASVRRSRTHEAELRQWAVRNSQLASVAERNRIAREMHDVVAHSLTVMVALSDGAAVVVKKDPAKAAEVLDQLSQTGRTALADMRRVLGVLREGAGPNRSPQPDHADMGALIEGFRQAGLPITFSQSGPPVPDDPALALTVYRIVQESLTNVLRYGTAVSRVQVSVVNRLSEGELSVRVSDDGHGTLNESIGTGRGIVGMRERAGIFAGTVDAGPVPRGGWTVEAVLHPAEGP